MKLPAFQVYPGDWRKDLGVQSLSYHDRGVWWELICLMHESEKRGVLVLNGHAMTDEAIARLLGLDNQILTTTLTNLLASGVASRDEDTGALICRRMVRDEKTRQVRAQAGKLGGNPALLNHEVNQKPTTGDKQIPTPSSSSSSSEQIPPSAGANGEFMAAMWLQQELQIPATSSDIRILAQVIDFEARNRGGPQAAAEWLVTQAEKAKLAGAVITVWWFKDKKYEGSNARNGNYQSKSDANDDAARRAIESIMRRAAPGVGECETGDGRAEGSGAIRTPPVILRPRDSQGSGAPDSPDAA